jgi:hypothetical protein
MPKQKRGKHKSVDKELRPSISWLESLPEVLKVVIGLCESARHSFPPGALRYRLDVAGGIKINAYGGKGVIDIFVKVANEDKQNLIAKLKDRWDV